MQNIQKSILNMVMQKWLNSDYLIIDTETTGLDNNAEVIEIAIINMHGDVLLNSLVKPTCSIPAAVTKINNITDEMVADAPLWRDVFPVIFNIIDGKKWLAWNSKFDARLIIQTGVKTGYFEDLPASKILDIAAKINNSQIDAKAIYDQWYGEFDSKRNNFKRQRLTTAAERHNVSVNGAHRALADCMMVLGVLNAVCHSDYAVFEARYAELASDNDKTMEAMKQANEAVKLAHSKFSKLAAENVALKSALNDAYKAVMGQAPEWSNWFSFENAIDEIELVCELWRNQTDDVIQFRQRIQELEAKLANPVLLPKTNGYWNEQEKVYEEAITLAKQRIRMAGFRCEGE
ncbi:3'-5' exonuclease [Salmonella enterica]|nr:3'-5' exonuclease [Salmonella enterica]